jgi:outer membrane protein, multidrug efflux system
MPSNRYRILIGTAGLALLAGCSAIPPQRPVPVPTPEHYDAIPPSWTEAAPADTAPRGDWWTSFNDPVLNDLEARAVKANPTLALALAHRDEAYAVLGQTKAAEVPEIDATGGAERERESRNRPLSTGTAATYNLYTVGGNLSYEVDLWGRVRATVAAARSEASATQADLASAQLSLQASVADAYARLRGLDAEEDLLVRSVDAYTKAYDLTRRRHLGGAASGLDENRAMTVLGNARAQRVDVANQRTTTEHELAALLGEAASTFHVAPVATVLGAPPVPVGTPGTLLQRRPDIAAAERRMTEANAKIGAAHAALYPTFTLGATGGYQTTGPALFSTPSSFWGIGPLSFDLPIFDGGKLRAALRQARSQFDEAAATYRSTVIGAYREVEDSLAAARDMSQEADEQQTAVKAAQATTNLSLILYREGAVNYLEVVTAQTDELTAERALLAVQTRRAQASVAIVKALGGPATVPTVIPPK